MILRKAFPNWKTDGGIFHELNTHTETPWRGVIDPNTLDLDYYGNRSGGKIVSVLVGALADGEPLKTTDVETLALLLLSKYGLSWSRMWDAVTSEYDPVSNYDMVETENINRQSNGGYGSTVNNSGTSENGIFGFNSTDAVPSNNSSDTGNTTTTGTTNNTDVDARTLTRKGNVGVTAGYQLVGGELDVRMRNFFNLVYDNIDEVLTIPVYGDCDETDEHGGGSGYVLPPATRTTLGGVIVGDGLQVTADGVLSAEQGVGAVESVNGKTGAVVLTYDDVGAPSLDEFQQIEDDTDENTRMINENAVNIAQNTEDIQTINDNVPFKFGVDSDGNYGYYKAGADTVTPFKSGGGYKFKTIEVNTSDSGVVVEVETGVTINNIKEILVYTANNSVNYSISAVFYSYLNLLHNRIYRTSNASSTITITNNPPNIAIDTEPVRGSTSAKCLSLFDGYIRLMSGAGSNNYGFTPNSAFIISILYEG